MTRAYYNEIDAFAAQWLRNLIHAGHIAPGDVDERSIVDVRSSDLAGYNQCHFFAGIGVWSYSFRRAGWPDSRAAWSGSCPCPPFSAAGKGQECPSCGGKRHLCHPRKTGHFVCLACGCDHFADARHLWPEFSRLIRQCEPAVVFGEQVASADGRAWLDAVSADLRLASYGFAGADLCAAGVGAPHIRQRLWWIAERVANANGAIAELPAGTGPRPGQAGGAGPYGQSDGRSDIGRLDNDNDARLEGQRSGHQAESGRIGEVRPASEAGEFGRLADADGGHASAEGLQRSGEQRQQQEDGRVGGVADASSGPVSQPIRGPDQRNGLAAVDAEDRLPGPTNGFWRNADWLHCRDRKWRPVEPGTFPLAHGASSRVGRLRAYGNAIVAQAASEVIAAYMETMPR